MKCKYVATFSLVLGDLLDTVKELETSINATLRAFGVYDTIKATTDVLSITITTDKEIPSANIEKLKTFLAKSLNDQIPDYSLMLTSFQQIQ